MADIASLTTGGAAAVGAGLAMGLSALAAAWSQGSLGSAGMGLVAERPELKGDLLVYIAIPETIVLFGFVIAIMLVGAVK